MTKGRRQPVADFSLLQHGSFSRFMGQFEFESPAEVCHRLNLVVMTEIDRAFQVYFVTNFPFHFVVSKKTEQSIQT